jgi:hypothetical protein
MRCYTPSLKQTFFAKQVDRFGFNGTKEYLIYNPFEGQIDTGNMMQFTKKCLF